MGKSDDGQRYPLLQNGGHWTASACRTQAFVHVQECVDTLRSLDVAVQQFHSEGRSGQFEISLAPLPPMEAVDTLVLTQEVIKNVAFKYGHEATMYPKPFADHPANGAHTHSDTTFHSIYMMVVITIRRTGGHEELEAIAVAET